VQVLVLQDDGSSLAAAITCAGLALADAAVPMYDLPVGLSKVTQIYNQFLLQPILILSTFCTN
jgi:exosome complex component MTR3